jgi:hypothetical protein
MLATMVSVKITKIKYAVCIRVWDGENDPEGQKHLHHKIYAEMAFNNCSCGIFPQRTMEAENREHRYILVGVSPSKNDLVLLNCPDNRA